MVVRGLPERLAKDAWWMDDAVPRHPRPMWLLVVAVVCADWLVWAATGGLGVVAWVLIVALAMQVMRWGAVPRGRSAAAWGLLFVALVPAVDLVQMLSVIFAGLGLLGFAALMIVPVWDAAAILQVMRRFPGAGLLQSVVDVCALCIAAPAAGRLRGVFLDWAVPLGVGAVFVVLMVMANPVVDLWLAKMTRFENGFSVSGARVAFWCVMIVLVWPFLRLSAMAGRLRCVSAARPPRWRSGLVNDRSVSRALVLFNAIFLVQSLLDLGYLWGGVALPEGMTYAAYAHRGAYPLLGTALLAGAFALLSQPYLGGCTRLRGLLYLWVAQTVLLVVSSILRLDLYVDVYGLTRLRFAAFVWMVVVALGLVLLIAQMVQRVPVAWFGLRAAGLGIVALYVCALVNIDGYVARSNLNSPRVDPYYVCGLSGGAVPAIAAYERRSGAPLCSRGWPGLGAPRDWREWGYRNARLRLSLAAIEAEVRT